MLLSDYILNDNIIKWERYQYDSQIYSKFLPTEWSKIVMDINGDNEWNNFLINYSDIVSCYILYDCLKSKSIGFCYIYHEEKNVISFHGGGWCKSVASTLYYFRGLILFIEYLLKEGLKIHTSCLRNNEIAFRFLRSIGCVTYKKTSSMFYMYITQKSMSRSKIYQRLRNNTRE